MLSPDTKPRRGPKLEALVLLVVAAAVLGSFALLVLSSLHW